MEVRWQRAARRGTVMGTVIAAHVALLLWVIVPPAAHPAARRRRPLQTPGVMQVELLEPGRATPLPAMQPPHSIRATVRAVASTPRSTPSMAAARAIRLAPPSAASSVVPAYVAGGNFSRRLHDSRLTPRLPRLPGGQRYLAANLHFVPLWQESFAAEVHGVSALLGLGWVDPVCKDTHLELTRSRLQQISDGHTPGDLQRLLREHHCD